MIKHLRFFMLNLLVLVSAAVMAQTRVVFSDGLPSDWTKTGTVAKQTQLGKPCIQLQTKASITSPAMTEAATKLTIQTTRSKNGTKLTVAYQIGTAKAVDIKSFTATEVTKGQWNDITVDIPTAAQVAGCKFIFTAATASYYISQMQFEAAGAPTKTETKTTFGSDIDGTTITFTGGEAPVGKSASVTPAEALNTSNGTLTYKSDRTDIVAVDETTGALTWGTAYGTAKITATYTAAEKALFKDSEAFYYVKHKRAAEPNTIVFDASDEDAFASIKSTSGYPKDDKYAFVDLNGDSYTFTVHNAMLNNYGGGLQLRKVSASDATQQGYVVSPTFSKFPYGYRVTVKYKDQNAPELECPGHETEVSLQDDANGTMYMDVPFADGTFKLLGGSQTAYVQSIELTPLAKKEATTMTFPQEEYTLNIGEEFTAPKATVKGEDGKAIEGLTLLYTSDNEDIAVVDENTGEVLLGEKEGTAVITAYFFGNETYKPCQASYKIKLTKKQPQPVTMTFPQDVYTCYTDEAPLFDGFQPTIKDEAGNELKLPVIYSSSNVDFCMVSGNGMVLLSQNPGEVTITAKFAGNDDYQPAQASYLIKVIKKEKKDAGISFEDTMIMIDLANPNTTVKDLGFLNPNNLAVTYSSNKTDVAEVDAEGNVTLKKAGRVNIDVTFAGNDEYKAASASCTLIVNDYRTTPELSFDQEEYTANMREGNTFSGATLYNELEVAPLSYTSSNEEVAEVAANGVVILRSTGETTITVWFAGDKNFKAASASYKLKVVDEVVNGIQGITIDNMPEDAKVYNLNGQRVNTKALKSGVYVVNGKKVVLK
ncbi:Ig-like domain-containing protein [Leyella stercorea]|uniref:Ig-like domain-containing protein n=1 Tax=Leyella stercorea TaxID=363265 RepID=UPI002431A0B1|nr:Ig-like domain-containing protein [Leyella stercorea]